MSTRAGTLRNTVDITACGIVNRVAEFSISIWQNSEFEPLPAQANTASTATTRVRQTALYENHPLSSLFGKYDDEPLWDGFEEALRRLTGRR